MTVQQTPAPARTDVRPAHAGSAADGHPFRAHGMLLSAGASAWAVATAIVGVGVIEDQPDLATFGIGSGLFQLGLLALLRVLWRTQALGSGRLARTFLRIETGFVLLAIASTTVDSFGISDLDQAGWAMLDAFWPLSMLGMFAIGIRIAIAGRWTGASRFWPMVAESWALVVIPTLGIFGTTAATVVSVVHLLVGYAVLGQLVARKRS
jgi:hypothetical protein